MRYGSYVLISPAKVEGAERWAQHYGSMGIFISRLLPVVRHLIGIPSWDCANEFQTLFALYDLGLGDLVRRVVLRRRQNGPGREIDERRIAPDHNLDGRRDARVGRNLLFLCASSYACGEALKP